MTSDDKRLEQRPTSGEAPFEAGEVFYSRTDRRGVIRSGNYIFRRVAGFSWEELVGAPHKIIRHPEMPKAVFWLLWDRILKGEVVGAYVKNRAKDGLHYWVFAMIAPWQDGFLSARIKPTSRLLTKVESVYAELLEVEQAGRKPEESAAILLKELRELGFDTYEDFMSHACSEELLSECAVLGLPPDEKIARAGRNLTFATALAEETERLAGVFSKLSVVPHNLSLAASRLEAANGPISTLSRNYGDLSTKMADWFNRNVIGNDSNFSNIKSRIKDARLMECAADVLHRCERQLLKERRLIGPTDLESERQFLTELAGAYLERARSTTAAVTEEAKRIQSACKDLRRELVGLNATRVLCNIENARLGTEQDDLREIIDRLGDSQKAIERHLTRIEENCAAMILEWEEVMRQGSADKPDLLYYGRKMTEAFAKMQGTGQEIERPSHP